MKLTLTRKIIAIALIGLFSQFSLAQDNAGAAKQIADIVASLNHFPSDADKATLMAISGNDELAAGLRAMATAVSSFAHSTNDEGKEAMAGIQSNAEAPDRAKALAGIIASLNHTASDDAKATLAELYP